MMKCGGTNQMSARCQPLTTVSVIPLTTFSSMRNSSPFQVVKVRKMTVSPTESKKEGATTTTTKATTSAAAAAITKATTSSTSILVIFTSIKLWNLSQFWLLTMFSTLQNQGREEGRKLPRKS